MAEAKSPQQSNPPRTGMNREEARRAARSGSASAAPSRPADRAVTPPAGGSVSGSGARRAATPFPSGGSGRRRGGNIITFIRETRSELRKVVWPSPSDARNLTVVVLALSITMGLLLGAFDYLFQELFRFLIAAG